MFSRRIQKFLPIQGGLGLVRNLVCRFRVIGLIFLLYVSLLLLYIDLLERCT